MLQRASRLRALPRTLLRAFSTPATASASETAVQHTAAPASSAAAAAAAPPATVIHTQSSSLWHKLLAFSAGLAVGGAYYVVSMQDTWRSDDVLERNVFALRRETVRAIPHGLRLSSPPLFLITLPQSALLPRRAGKDNHRI